MVQNVQHHFRKTFTHPAAGCSGAKIGHSASAPVGLRTRSAATAVLLLLVCGCQSNTQQVALEDQLRSRDADIRRLRNQVTESEQLLADQDSELAALREPAGEHSKNVFSEVGQTSVTAAIPEAQVAWGSVTALKIHKLTSGLTPVADNADRQMNVVLQPLDDEGELVKVAGELKVHVAAVNSNGQTTELARQEYSITDSRRLWSRGLVSSGFHVQLPLPAAALQDVAGTGPLLVTATLQLGSDRIFSASTLLPIE